MKSIKKILADRKRIRQIEKEIMAYSKKVCNEEEGFMDRSVFPEELAKKYSLQDILLATRNISRRLIMKKILHIIFIIAIPAAINISIGLTTLILAFFTQGIKGLILAIAGLLWFRLYYIELLVEKTDKYIKNSEK